MLSDADKKAYFKDALEGFRECDPEEVEVIRIAFATALSSGEPITALSAQDMLGDDDDEARPDGWRERYLGLVLDNMVFGHLPVADGGEILPDAEVPAEVMTVGGAALTTSVEDGSLCLTDRYGARAVIKGVVCRTPGWMQCVTDHGLMQQEWLSDEPMSGSGTVERLQGPSGPRAISLSRALGPWDEFSGKSKKDQSLFRVRTRLGNPKVRELAAENQLFRVSCTLAEDQLDADRLPLSFTELNRFEDALLMRLATLRPRTVPLAAVAKAGTYDLYYSAEHNGALFAAIEAAGDQPFPVRTTKIVGDVPVLLKSLTPPDKR